MAGGIGIAFLFDVDDTLLNNDRVEAELGAWLDREVGAGSAAMFRKAFEEQRAMFDYADYLGAVQRCCDRSGRDPNWLRVGDYLLDYPFADRLYPRALEVLRQCQPCWLITDGDGVMQPRKLRRSGLWDAVEGRVRVYVHKERMLDELDAEIGAARYVFVDDKPRVLDAVKRHWGERVTTVMPLQGHYAHDPHRDARYGAPDRIVDCIAELVDLCGHERGMAMRSTGKP